MKEKSLPISEFVLKIVAIVTMTLDHIGYFLLGVYGVLDPSSPLYVMGQVFRIIGRLAFPLFAFMLAEGMRHTRSKEKYLLRLGIMLVAMLTVEVVLVYGFKFENVQGNPFMDLVIDGLVIYLLDFLRKPGKKKLLAILSIFPIALSALSFAVNAYEMANNMTILWFPSFLRADYSIFGLLMALGFYFAFDLGNVLAKRQAKLLDVDFEFFKMQKEYQRLLNIEAVAVVLITTVLFWALSFIGMDAAGNRPFDVYGMSIQSYSLIVITLLVFYSGKRGYDSKAFRIFSYLYFPVHLALLYLIFSISFGM